MALPRFGINRFDSASVERFVADVRMAEDLGWDIAFTPDSQLGLRDPYIMLAMAARSTTRVGLGTLLTNPVTRHPTVTASAFATLDEVSDGRAFLVLGIGDTAVEHSGLQPASVAALRASTADIRALLRGEVLDVGRPEPARLLHARPVPVWVAAAGPRMQQAAGAVGDGVFIRVGRDAANLDAAIESVRAGAVAAGRDPAEVRLGLIVHTVLVDEPERALRIGRTMAAGYYDHSPVLFERAGLSWDGPPPEVLKRTIRPDFHHTRDLAAAGEQLEFLPPEAVDAFVFHGQPSEVAAQMIALIQRYPDFEVVVPQPPSARLPHEDAPPFYMERMAREVLPVVRQALGA